MRLELVLALLVGGMAAAPLAPLFVGWLDARLLGVVVGAFVCLTTFKTLLGAASVSSQVWWAAYSILSAVIVLCVAKVARREGTAKKDKSQKEKGMKGKSTGRA